MTPSSSAVRKPPVLLVVLDGWGTRAAPEFNAVLAAAPYFHDLLGRYPNTQLTACGREVGLPLGVMGNSEVGHMNLGAGRRVYQDISRIDKSIEDGEFFQNPAFCDLIARLRKQGKRLHLFGLVSDGGVHASDRHLRNLLKLAAQQGLAPEQVCIHAVTDGRDTPPQSGLGYLDALTRDIEAAGVGRIVSVIGRYWAMDRDNRWERVQRAHDLLVDARGAAAPSARAALERSYASGVTDEFIEPFVIGEGVDGRLHAGDGLICFNFRSDRMRQICMALTFEAFDGFERASRPAVEVVTMTQYRADFPFAIAYPRTQLKGLFAELVSAAGLRQKRIAETEKYAHVTFFFSGGNEQPLPGEERILIPSPRVATYDLQPEMSAAGVCDAILEALRKAETDVYIVNFANADMVGHTGDFEAACKAVATIDACLRKVVSAVEALGGTVAITADHGNSEMLWDEANDSPHTAHTLNPVPIVFCDAQLKGAKLRARGVLADVAPTLLEILQLEPSAGMDGVSLLV